MKKLLSLFFLVLLGCYATPAWAQTAADTAQLRLRQQQQRTQDAKDVLATQRSQTSASHDAVDVGQAALKQQRRDTQAQKRHLKVQKLTARSDEQRQKIARAQVHEEKDRTRDQEKLLKESTSKP